MYTRIKSNKRLKIRRYGHSEVGRAVREVERVGELVTIDDPLTPENNQSRARMA